MWVMITSNNKSVCQQTLSLLQPLEGNNIIVTNGGSESYIGLEIPSGWDAINLKESKTTAEILNMLFRLYPDEEYYGIIPENCLIEAIDFENKLKTKSKGRYIVGCDDGNKDHFPFTGVRLWPGKVLRVVGWWALPTSKELAFEMAWIKTAWDMVIWERAADVKVTYLPKNESENDKLRQKYDDEDKVSFDIWRNTEYYKIFRKLMFGGDKWRGRTNFLEENSNEEARQNSTA